MDRVDQLVAGEMAAVKHRLDQGVVIAAPDPFDHRQVLVAVEARRADQHQLRDALGMSHGDGQDDLAAQARADQVVRRALDEFVEEHGRAGRPGSRP